MTAAHDVIHVVPADRTGSHAAAAGRNTTLDVVKAVAIVLVVVGHSLQTAYPNFDEVPAFRVIYAFHMPLFMFVSGMVATCSRDLTSLGSLRRRALTLVVPFAAWYALGYVLTSAWRTLSVVDYTTRLVRSPDFGLWFLWILFLCHVVLAATLRLERRLGPLVFGAALVAFHYAPFHAGGPGAGGSAAITVAVHPRRLCRALPPVALAHAGRRRHHRHGPHLACRVADHLPAGDPALVVDELAVLGGRTSPERRLPAVARAPRHPRPPRDLSRTRPRRTLTPSP